MDEPLSNLDAKLRVQTRAEIARLHQRLKTTVVYVTHDQVEAMTMGSRIAVMNEGLLQQVGTPQVLYDTPINRFVAGFIGSPSMNFVEVHVDGIGDGARLVGPADWSIPLPPRYREASDAAAPARRSSPASGPSTSTSARPAPASASFRARADVVEYLGNEELLHVNAADQDVVAIVGSEHRVRPGDIVNLVLPLEKLHLFDGETRPDARPGRRGRSRPDDDRSDAPTITSAPEDPSGADLVERVVESRVLHRGRYLTFRVDTIERADGRAATRDIAGHPGAVAILAIDDRGRVLLVRQYRVAVGEALLEIPAGTLDVGRRRARSRTRTSPRGASSRRRPGCGPGRGASSPASTPRPGSPRS